jgi:RNA polymerase sigma factor (sigma-70 family)
MQTPQEIVTFRRPCAEVPHPGVADTPNEAWVERGSCRSRVQEDEAYSLVERAKGGDRASFEQLLAALRPRAVAAAMKLLRNIDDAEDAVQEASIKIWRNLAQFEGRCSFSTWAHRIVMNTSLDLLRCNGSRRESQADLDCRPVGGRDGERTPESDLASHEVQALVRNAIAGLPPLHRQHARHRLACDLQQPFADSIALAAA